MAEYGVVLALITLAVVTGLTLLSGRLSAAFSAVAGIVP
jgi:Flp pilus assembly pilin Flp